MKWHTEKCQVIKINLNSNSSTVSDAISTSSRYLDAKEPSVLEVKPVYQYI